MAEQVTTSTARGDAEAGQVRSLAPVLTGIVDDVQRLLKQHLELFKAEVKDDLRKTRDGSLSLVVGGVAALLGVVLLLFMCVYLLNLTGLPLWACFGIVGAVVIAIAGALIYWGIKRFGQVTPLAEQSTEEVKEDVRWIKNRL